MGLLTAGTGAEGPPNWDGVVQALTVAHSSLKLGHLEAMLQEAKQATDEHQKEVQLKSLQQACENVKSWSSTAPLTEELCTTLQSCWQAFPKERLRQEKATFHLLADCLESMVSASIFLLDSSGDVAKLVPTVTSIGLKIIEDSCWLCHCSTQETVTIQVFNVALLDLFSGTWGGL